MRELGSKPVNSDKKPKVLVSSSVPKKLILLFSV